MWSIDKLWLPKLDKLAIGVEIKNMWVGDFCSVIDTFEIFNYGVTPMFAGDVGLRNYRIVATLPSEGGTLKNA